MHLGKRRWHGGAHSRPSHPPPPPSSLSLVRSLRVPLLLPPPPAPGPGSGSQPPGRARPTACTHPQNEVIRANVTQDSPHLPHGLRCAQSPPPPPPPPPPPAGAGAAGRRRQRQPSAGPAALRIHIGREDHAAERGGNAQREGGGGCGTKETQQTAVIIISLVPRPPPQLRTGVLGDLVPGDQPGRKVDVLGHDGCGTK